MVALDNKLYVFGGCAENSRMNDLYSFDVTCNRWERQPNHDVMEARGGAGLVAVGGCVYVIAGFNGREMNDVHKFDTVTKLWTTMSFQKSLSPRSVFYAAGNQPLGSGTPPVTLTFTHSNGSIVFNIKHSFEKFPAP
jgi:N-acetylneuraminic acid mutarotase